MVGTTKTSGWALFLFLLGFTILGTSFAGGGALSLIAGSITIVISAVTFKVAREKEEA